MLQLTLHIIIISFTCIIWGLPLLLIARRKYPLINLSATGCILILFFSGLLTVAVFSSWLVILVPLKFSYLLTASALLLLLLYFFAKKRVSETVSLLFQFRPGLNIPNTILVIAAILLFLVVGTVKSVNIDTQMYHLQIVRWTNEYGTVPGLANLYPRLGLGSSWFNLISFFHLPLFGKQNFTYLNCTLVLWFFFFLLHKFIQTGKLEQHTPLQLFYFLLILYFFFDWQLFRDTANSTSYDFIVTVLIIIAVSLILDSIRKPEISEFILPAITILGLSVISFKLSGVFVIVLLIWKLFGSEKKGSWHFAFLTGLIVLIPVLLRNYITTGYPFYPLGISINNPDWKLPMEFTEGMKNYIVLQNRYYNTINLAAPENEFLSLTWVPAWFKGILIQHKIVCITAFLSLTIFFMRKRKDPGIAIIRTLIILLFIMSLGWFITAPDPRFGYGFLLCLALLPVSLLIGKHIPALWYKIATLLLTMGLCVYIFQKGTDIKNNPMLLIQTANTEQPHYTKMKVDNATVNFTEKVNSNWNNRCFFTPLPCLCELNPYLKFRSNRLEDGFRMMPIIDSNFVKHYNY